MSRRYALGVHFEEMIDQLVLGGRFGDGSEVVREAMRLLESRERVRQVKVAEIRQSIVEGRARGVMLSEDEVFGPLEADLAAAADRAGE